MLVLVGALLVGAVLTAVHHAEVLAHRLGEPYGSLLLAVAVTVIEVGMIMMLMTGGSHGAESLARDTVFAAVMITCNGIAGLALLVGDLRHHAPRFRTEGTSSALATVAALTGLTLVLPSFTTTTSGDTYALSQLIFASVASLVLWGGYVSSETGRHRDFFLPNEDPKATGHVDRPSKRESTWSLVLLLVALVAVVGLAKVLSPSIEAGVAAAGLPHAVVGVVIAFVVLLPESLAAYNNATRNRVQVSLNLAYGSAIASIGLTIPTISIVASVMGMPLILGLGDVHLVLLLLTLFVCVMTIAGGRATRVEASVHLTILTAYVFLTAVP